MTSRRQFLAATAAAGLWANSGRAAYPYGEFESRIARRDFRDITKDVLPTPCMLVDRAILERNIRRMADNSKANRIHVRPHIKVHKSVEIARRQVAEGAIGLTCATIAEAELLCAAGLKNVLWTKQPASANNIGRAVALSKKDPTFMFVVDDPQLLGWVEEAAAAADARLRIAVAVFAGMTRQGIDAGPPAVELARKTDQAKHCQLEGLMAYSGPAAHTKGWEARRQKSFDDLAGARETTDLLRKAGLPVNFVSGGSTGTYNIDHENGLTELEAGSYVFMDTVYMAIGGKDSPEVYSDFGGALTVLTTVDSKHHPHEVAIDYGNKSMVRPTDKVKDMPWIQVGTQGAEYGLLKWNDGDRELKLGQRVEIYCTNLDMSTNAFNRYYVMEGDHVVDVWPIMGRSGAAQR